MPTPPVLRPNHPSVQVSGRFQPRLDSLLLAMEISEQANGQNTLRLKFTNWTSGPTAPGYVFDDDSVLKLGDEVAIGFIAGTAFQEIFRGPSMAFEAEFPSGTPPTYTILASSKKVRAHVKTRGRIQRQPTITLNLGGDLLSARAEGSRTCPVREVTGTTGGNPVLHRGTRIALNQLGSRLSGRFQITQCCHRFDLQEGYRVDFVAKPVG